MTTRPSGTASSTTGSAAAGTTGATEVTLREWWRSVGHPGVARARFNLIGFYVATTVPLVAGVAFAVATRRDWFSVVAMAAAMTFWSAWCLNKMLAQLAYDLAEEGMRLRNEIAGAVPMNEDGTHGARP